MFRNTLPTVAVALLATLTIALLVYLPRIAHRDRYVMVGTSINRPTEKDPAYANEPDDYGTFGYAAMYVYDRQTDRLTLVTGAGPYGRIALVNNFPLSLNRPTNE